MNYHQNGNRLGNEVNNGALRTSWDSTAVTDAMQASWFTCSMSEDDFIDNIQPNLITASLTGSLSSNFATDENCVVGLQSAPQPYCENHNDLQLDIAKSIADSNGSVLETVHNTTEGYLSRPDSPQAKLSLSMHDISTIPSFPLTSKSSNFSTSTIQSQSMTTDASIPKSKDSGFPRSLSCQSLSSGKSYAHVQSKVKEYIRQIKEENGGRKAHNTSRCHIEQEPACAIDESVSVKKLMPIIDKLKDELDDKDKMIIKLQENYDALLTRYAAAETRIDHFRINSVDSDAKSTFSNYSTPDCKKIKSPANPNLLLIPELQEILNDSRSDIDESYTKKSSKQSPSLSKSSSKVLNPITKFYSSSVRLDKFGSQPSVSITNSEDLGCSMLKDEQLKLGNRHPSSSTLIDRSDLDPRNRIHKSSTSIVKELSPERLNNQLAENPFIKVQRWQESLPSFELIEPSSYDSLNMNNSKVVSGSYRDNKTYDQCHIASSSSYGGSAINECNSSTKNLSNYLLSRSISQPNYAQINYKTKCSLDQPSPQVGTTEPHSVKRSLSLKVIEDVNSCTKQGTQPLPPIMSGRHRNLGITECSHLSRKKLIGQKARLVLFEYLKNSECNSNLYSISKSPKILERLSSVNSDKSISKKDVDPSVHSYDDRDISLVNCLDEMNQCAQNLKGKSEAIMQVLAKQLKDP